MMNKKEDRVPFYKELYYKVENELGVYDTIVGLALGAVVCGLYWSHCWKNH